MSNKYSEGTALNKIMQGYGVTDLGAYIEVVRGALGIKRLGALDYLVNHCKRKVVWVNEARKRKK